MEQFLHSTDICAFLRAHTVLFHCPDQQILRGMFHIDEFQDLGLIALLFQQICSQSIGERILTLVLKDHILSAGSVHADNREPPE